ncbi:MAG: AIPR family protein [Propionicimonas sp.]
MSANSLSNDALLLGAKIGQSRKDANDSMSVPEHEAYFVAKYYLDQYQPTHDDLMSGLVDGARDGGIDAAYVLVDGFSLRDDAALERLSRSPSLDLILMQVKNTTGHSETAVEKMLISVPELLDLARDETALSKTYNSRLLEATRRFLKAVEVAQMPQIHIFVCFAALRAGEPHPNVVARGIDLQRLIGRTFTGSNPEVAFFGASEILQMSRRPTTRYKTLRLAENPITTDFQGGYIAVVNLDDFDEFITDPFGRLDAGVFEANVRDYEGETAVNRHIQRTLADRDEQIDFWWLNNGVTIVANRVQLSAKQISLESPQIVNGLQTSHEIFKRERSTHGRDPRSVLVKVVEATQASVRDAIIQATNSQTILNTSSLRATDSIQRQIEEHLQAKELYYERRRNSYANLGMPIDRLVSVEQMGQALVSTLGMAPHVARGSISSVFADDDIYGKLFSREHPVGCFLGSIELLRWCEAFLRRGSTTRDEVDNFVFQLSMLASIAITRTTAPKAAALADVEKPSDELLGDLLATIREEYSIHTRVRGEVLFERLSKAREVTRRLLQRSDKELARRRPFRR